VADAVAAHLTWRSSVNATAAARAAAQRNVFVLTDEHNAVYLAQLRSSLRDRTSASRVCFESDVQEMTTAPDNYVRYAAGISIAERAAGSVRFHPRNLALVRALCSAGGATKESQPRAAAHDRSRS
jgi:hypothetical protein